MNDKQSLLNTSGESFVDKDDNENSRQVANNRFSDWRQCFSGKETDDNYKKMDDGIEHSDKDVPVGVFRLFRFADRRDLLLMFISLCLITVHTMCILGNLFLFGRITGLFATQSFAASCQNQYQNAITSIKNNSICPLGIELNPSNYVRLHKLCRYTDMTLSTTLVPQMPSFHEKVMHLVHWLLIIGVISFLCSVLHFIIWTNVMKRITTRMNVLLFRSLIQRNMSYLDTNPNSQFNSKLFSNIATIERGIGFEFLILLAILWSLISSLILSFIINWQLTLILLCIIPIVVGSSFVFSKITAHESMDELNTYSTAGQIVQEVFSSLRTVHSLNGSTFEQKRYERDLDSTLRSSIRKGAVFGIFTGWSYLMTYVTYALGFIFGSLLMSYGNHDILDISDIIVIVSICAQGMQHFGMIGPFFQSFSEARGAAAPVFRLIDEAQVTGVNEPDVLKEDTSDEESIYDINGDIEFDNIHFTYPSRKDASALQNLNLIARAHQTTALIGSSGCGKSTSISLLLRFYEPSSGRIMIDGRSITDYNIKQLRQHIGVVSQEPILFGMSIYENIRLGKLNATRAEIEEAAQQSNAHHFIMQLPHKYETLVGERGVQLSGGEKQRIALARALVKQPTILLLDEATSALDNVSEKIVQEALDRACKNRTTIVIAHRLSTIQNADHIYVLDKGTVIEEGTHVTLMAKEGSKYQTMITSQQIKGMVDDDEDEIISMGKVPAEEEKRILERSRLLSNIESIDMNQKSSTPSSGQSIFIRLLSMNSPEWISLVIGCIACLFVGLGQPVFAILLTKIIHAFKDCGRSDRHRQVLISSVLFLLLGLLVLFLRFFQFTAFAVSGSKLTQRIRSKAFACLLRQEVGYFDRPENSSGAICTRLSSDASAVQDMAGTRLGVICEGFALSCFGLLFGIFFSWQLTLIVVFPFIFQGIIVYINIQVSKRLKEQSDVILQQASTLTVEVIQNMRTVKQLTMENEVLQQYSQYLDQVLKKFFRPNIVSSLAYGTYWALESFILAFLYWCSLILVEKKELALPHVIMVFSFAMFSLQSLRIVTFLSERIGSSMAAGETFFDLFDRTPTIDNTSTGGQELVGFRGEIEFDQVQFVYPARPTSIVLNKLELTIKSGQRVALVGTSGCGKSTIIQLLERFYDVTHGRLLLDGINIRQLNLHWVRSRLGLVSQEPILFDLTIAENITYGLENVPMEDIINAATKANIHQFIEQLPQGYETKVGMKGSFLSGGEKQRIAIARVLIRRPKVLLLDEATSAMDSYNEQIVQQALEQAQIEDPSRTSLIIAHRLSTIRSCDLIYVLDNGHIVESGTHAELIQQRGGFYYRMLATQSNL